MAAFGTVAGRVVHGDHRGRELGYPTANVRVGDDAPPFGVYAARVGGVPAAVSIGVRPTFATQREPLLEAHLLDFDGDLYGEEITVELLAYLRDEIKFDDVDALVAQIEADIALVREVVAK